MKHDDQDGGRTGRGMRGDSEYSNSGSAGGGMAPGKRTSTQGLRGGDPTSAILRGLDSAEAGLAAVTARHLPTMRAAIDARDMGEARAASAALASALARIDAELATARRWATLTESAGAASLIAPLEAARDTCRAEAAPVLALAPPPAPALPVAAAFDYGTMMDTAPAYDAAEDANRTQWGAELDAAEAPRDNVIEAADRFGAVQRRAAGAAHDPAAVQHHAAAGVAGTGAPIPHLDAIQASFGAHDVTGVRAHVGGPAADASAAIGAEAYATGNDVAFASSPSLFVAAHEAAHVVQQRAGVSLLGGVGEAGDSYEQHADAVAECVVRGESAERLLGAASRVTSPSLRTLQMSPTVTKSISTNLTGHASPRWERTHGKDRASLNLGLSRERADSARASLRRLLEDELLANGINATFDIAFSGENVDGSVEINAEAAGDKETTDEADGDVHSNRAAMRRVDITMTINRRTRGEAEASTTRSKTIPAYCDPEATEDWAVKMELSGGAGHLGVGGAIAVAWLKNRLTNQEAHCMFVGAGGGVGISTPGADIFSDYTDFRTDAAYTFDDFDGTVARLTQLSGGILIVGYGFTYLSFPTLGANSIDLGGLNMGQLGADASVNVGKWIIEYTKGPSVCHDAREVTEDVEELTAYQYDEQERFEHTMRFETQSSEVSEVEAILLDDFIKTVVRSYLA